MTTTHASISAVFSLLLLAGAPVSAGAQDKPVASARPAPTEAAAVDPSRRAVDAHLARAPKRKAGMAMRLEKDDRARTDAAGTPTGRPPAPLRARGGTPKGTGR